MPRVARITLFPIKSLPGVEVPLASTLAGGPLAYDRRWAIVDAAWKFVNGKQCLEIHRLRAEFAADLTSVAIGRDDAPLREFDLRSELGPLAAWLSELLGRRCRVVENDVLGYPDDVDLPGPTVIGAGTLAAVASWFPGLTAEEVRLRLRTNVELDAAEPFWEDQLALGGGEIGRPFRLGQVRLRGRSICRRCIVPTRDSQTGAPTPQFAAQFMARREAELPPWSPAAAFDQFYRCAVNTTLAEPNSGGIVRVGDEVEFE